MVLFSLEQCLGEYVRENAADTSELPKSQVDKHLKSDSEVPSIEDIVQGTYISEILDLAISVARFSSDKGHLSNLKSLADGLKLYDIRNAVCHPNRPFSECFWHRVSALVTDPAVGFLQFHAVQNAFAAAIQDKITLPGDDWFRAVGFELANNLPEAFEHDITGFIGRNKERNDLLKRLKNKKMNLLALVGVGGTGKTALTLDVLHELVLDPATSDWVDEVVYVSAKTERLTKDGPVPIEQPLDSLDAVKEAILKYLVEEHELNCPSFDQLKDQLADRRLLICIDNLETLLRDHEEIFEDFYAEMPERWRVLVTSRVPINSATVIPLAPMQLQPATHLARQYVTRRGGTPLDAEILGRIVSRADSNPLAIRVCIDGYLAGVDLEEALQNAQSNLLEFSYTNLLSVLPQESNHVLECLFAAGERLSRAEMCTLLDADIDVVATGLSALLRTSLIVPHHDDTEELYGLSTSVHELLLRQPLDEKTRFQVIQKLVERRSAIAVIKSESEHRDPLDFDYINEESEEAAKVKAYEAFRAMRKRAAKTTLVSLLNRIRQSLSVTPHESILYRVASCLYFELNDLASAEQLLEEADRRNVLDSAGLLLLAEHRKDSKDFDGCKNISDRLLADGWLTEGRTSRRNLVRLAHVSWLVSVWLGKAVEIAAETREWETSGELRATKGCIYVTALRRLIEKETNTEQRNTYINEIVRCLSALLSVDGYLGFLIKEAMACLKQILLHQDLTTLEQASKTALVDFVQRHFSQICAVHREVSLGDDLTTRLLENVGRIDERPNKQTDTLSQQSPLENDARLAEYGYLTVEIYHWPEDNLGNRRSFCFARGTDGKEYYVSRRAMQDPAGFYDLKVGDRLSVRPKAEFDEGGAIPVADAMQY